MDRHEQVVLPVKSSEFECVRERERALMDPGITKGDHITKEAYKTG